MEKYKLNTLDPLEFEEICAEILSVKLGYKFRIFKAGVDGGIDALAIIDGKQIIVQCKRYANYSSLKKVLDLELQKIEEKNNVGDYFLMVSFELSPKELEEIYNKFSKYMKNMENIIDGKIIANFLDDEKNQSILRKHVKLWLYNSSILNMMENQNIFIDSEVLLDDIKKSESFYVENRYFKKCLELLSNNNCLLIYGNPGVGKSTISKMLVLYFINKYGTHNIKVRFSSVSDYEALKKSISYDQNDREIILIDDFLGQIYSEIGQNNTRSLLSLIQYIKKYPNKILILNSRIGILKNAYNNISFFESRLNELNINFIELGEYSEIEKGRILYNYLSRQIENKEYFDEIKKDKRYWQIIQHKNYNPRLIENISKKSFYEGISPNNYFSKVMNTLMHPFDVWSDEYANHIQDEDRILLSSIFSLSNYMVDYMLLEKVFWHRVKMKKLDTSRINLFDSSMKRMVDSYIKISIYNNIKKVSMINNSLNDFFDSFYEENKRGRDDLLLEANVSDQLVKLEKWDLRKKM